MADSATQLLAKVKKGKRNLPDHVDSEPSKELEEGTVVDLPLKKKKRRFETDDAEADKPVMMSDDLESATDEGGLSQLLKLRSLLAPTHQSEQDAQKSCGGRPLATGAAFKAAGPDWTTRYQVVDPDIPPTPFAEVSRQIHPTIERSLAKVGLKSLFPIQAATIPFLTRSAEASFDEDSPYSCDVCIAAPTGQGKTLAYAIPIVQALLNRSTPQTKALVLLPTRDLALQVARVFEMIRSGLGQGVAQVRTLCLVGHKTLAEEVKGLAQQPPDVIVCTPGRLTEHYFNNNSPLDLSSLRWFVVDEADRLLTQAYHRWLDILERVCPSPADAASTGSRRRVQKLLLSATMTWNPQKLALLKLKRPLYFFSSQTGNYATPVQLRQHMLPCTKEAKPLALLHILSRMLRGVLAAPGPADKMKAIVFCSSVDKAHRLARLLQILSLTAMASEDMPADQELYPEGKSFRKPKQKRRKNDEIAEVDVDSDQKKNCESDEGSEVDEDGDETEFVPLHVPRALKFDGAIAEFSSNLPPRERTALLNKFRKGSIRCLVCSDVVARGIDIPEVSMVVNYTPPTSLSAYIHRIGRTARAGRAGDTFTLIGMKKKDARRFKNMLSQSADCRSRVTEYLIPAVDRNPLRPGYQEALGLLQQCFTLEETGKLNAVQPLENEDLEPLKNEDVEAADVTEKVSNEAPSAKSDKRENSDVSSDDSEDEGNDKNLEHAALDETVVKSAGEGTFDKVGDATPEKVKVKSSKASAEGRGNASKSTAPGNCTEFDPSGSLLDHLRQRGLLTVAAS